MNPRMDFYDGDGDSSEDFKPYQNGSITHLSLRNCVSMDGDSLD